MQKPVSGFALPVFLLLTALLLSAGCISAGTETYIVGVESSSNPPSIIYSDSGELSGFDVEAIRWIAEQEGFAITFLPVAWDNILPSLQAGKIDMIFSAMTITDERAKLVSFSDPYWTVNQGIAVLNGSSWTMSNFNAKEMRVAVQRGTTSQKHIESLLGDNQTYSRYISLCSSFDDMILEVSLQSADCCIADDTTLISYLKSDPSLVMLGTIPGDEAYGAAVRKEDTKLLQLLNEGIAKFAESEKRQELISKYF